MMVEDAVFEGVCAQAGLVRVYDTNRLFDTAAALASAPLPKGPNVGIISMTGGNAVVCSDTCAYLGLEVPELDENTKDHFSENVLAEHAPRPSNPIDLAGDFSTPLLHARCAEALAELDYIHGLIVTPPSLNRTRGGDDKITIEAVSRIAAIPGRYGKPVLALGRQSADDQVATILRDAGIPLYQSPEDGAYAMNALVSYATFQSQGD